MRNRNLEPRLMQMVESQEGDELSTRLSLVLTRSSLAHQYALISLAESPDYAREQELLGRIEEVKGQYFFARDLLAEIDPEKLFAVETELQFQKEAVFGEKALLH